MKEMTKYEEKKVYKILKTLFLALAILLFVVAENYLVVQLFKRQEVAVQDLTEITCEQTAEGKYYVSSVGGTANVYNGTGRNVKDLVVTVRYVNALGKDVTSYEIEAGDFGPQMLDGKYNAYLLSFRVEPNAEVLSDAQIIWLEFDVESYKVEWTTLDYLMIGVFVVACVSTAMYLYSKKVCESLEEGEATSTAVIGEEAEDDEPSILL